MATKNEQLAKTVVNTGAFDKPLPVLGAPNGANLQSTMTPTAAPGAPTYAGTFENQLSDIYDQIQNRQPFQYDVNNDALYQGYKDQYIQGGKLAMKDTMGQAAALTGGYGSTYGQQVGQQAYNAYLQNLTNMIPELYNMAYNKYRDEGTDLQNLYGLTADRRDTEYNQWRDSLSDYNYEEQKQYERQQYEDEKTYKRQQDAYANVLAYIKAGINPSDAELASAGMTRARSDSLLKLYHPELFQKPAAAAGGGGGNGGKGGNGGTGKVTPVESGKSVKDYVDYANYLDKEGKKDDAKALREDVQKYLQGVGVM